MNQQLSTALTRVRLEFAIATMMTAVAVGAAPFTTQSGGAIPEGLTRILNGKDLTGSGREPGHPACRFGSSAHPG